MPQPITPFYPAHAFFGPKASFPAAQTVGDGGLAVASDQSNTLYQVQSGNWVAVSASGGGGPGSDTSAVHRAADTSSPETGSAAITGDLLAQGQVSSHSLPVVELSPDDPQVGTVNVTGTIHSQGSIIGVALQASSEVIGASFLSTTAVIILSNGANTWTMSAGDPTNPTGSDPVAGDFYTRTDTPSTPTQRLYTCTVGGPTPTWVGLL